MTTARAVILPVGALVVSMLLKSYETPYFVHVVAFVVVFVAYWAQMRGDSTPRPQFVARTEKCFESKGPKVMFSNRNVSVRCSFETEKGENATTETSSTRSSLAATGSSRDDDDLDLEGSMLQLQRDFPQSTPAERRRFLEASRNVLSRAKTQLQSFLDWHEEHAAVAERLFEGEETCPSCPDAELWDRASQIAQVSSDESRAAGGRATLPQIARMYAHNDDGSPIYDRDGHRILQVIPGQIDPTLAPCSTYGLALALYIHFHLDRYSTETVTVLVDVRGGRGWPNIPPLQQLPFIQTTVQLLLSMFPERLHQSLLYPVPSSALWIWNMIKMCLDPCTAGKIHPLCGVARIVSEPPSELMEEFLDPDICRLLEAQRVSLFREEPSTEATS